MIKKGIGVALIISGLILLVLKVLNLGEARESWNAWASPDSGFLWLLGALTLELVLLSCRLMLGYLLYRGKNISVWSFYPLAVLTALSGLSGIVLVIATLIMRFWPRGSHAVET
ncbi:hypothetical protein SAMN05421690_101378 [Nitrosomonas sp. Nm51]|uniref:hypothetical protein n=1 Tax=Nitrosomonas sp. Nm51 TaxID=133720 RepID=UPI0008B4E87B|nr:hypothetical protein [Nitrosomonas sp. Nm51]SER23251.1 hypothetical protein SAMN05421690_101378 [Nitrosomonas sp. Nm51]